MLNLAGAPSARTGTMDPGRLRGRIIDPGIICALSALPCARLGPVFNAANERAEASSLRQVGMVRPFPREFEASAPKPYSVAR